MKRLTVRYCGWGEDWPLAHLADDAGFRGWCAFAVIVSDLML